MYHALKTYAFLTPALYGGEWSVSIATSAHRLAGWVVAGADMDSWPLKMGPVGCLVTSVRNYHFSSRNNPEERSSKH